MGFGLNANAPVLNLNPDQQTVKHVQLPRARRVEVRVVDVNGVGMAGVEVIPTSLAGRAVEINDHGRRRTDSNGYILRGGFAPLPTDYMITALATETVRRTSQGNGLFLAETQFTHCPARALVRLTDPNVTTQVKIVLRKIKTLRGANMSPSGNGITFNQTEGDFSLGAAGPGIYQVQAAADGYAPCWSDPINTDESQATLISLSQGCMLTGRIINQSGDPVNNARVIPLSWASDPHPRTQLLFASDKGAALTADGLFTLSHIPAGMESLKIMHAHYAPKTVRDIDITAGQITDIDGIVLSSGGSIEGFVLDEQDNPLANQPLVFCDAMTGTTNVTSQRWATVVTDANGFYAVHHLPTQLCYVYQDKLWRMRGVISRAVTPKAGETVRLDFGGAFKVRGIIEAQNEVLPQRRVTLRPAIRAHFECFTMTDDSGFFALSGIVPGTYQLAYEDQKSATRWQEVTAVTVVDTDLDLGVLDAATTPSRTSEVTPAALVSQVPTLRHLIVQLPLLQPRFHWTFMSQADALAGKLTLRITRGQETTDIIVFENSRISEGWKAIDSPESPKVGELYFGFQSIQPYLTAPDDRLDIEFHVTMDLDGIGAMQTGILRAGTYRAQGTYTTLTDEYVVPDMFRALPQETLDKLRKMFEFMASPGDWEPQWALEITGDNGWLDPEQRKQVEQLMKKAQDMDSEP